MNETIEILFSIFMGNTEARKEIEQQREALFEGLIEAEALDGIAVADLMVETLRKGFYAGYEAAQKLTMAKINLAARNKRQLERTRGEA